MTITSPVFAAQGAIPVRYTCQGADRSPPLIISGVPPAARSLVLIVDDPDAPDPRAPRVTWVHWLLYNLPPTLRRIDAGATAEELGGASGRNSWHRTGYGGPCPPIGRHRYRFKLYALDTRLMLDHPEKAALEAAMRGHVLAAAVLVGTYRKR
ncbi:MAG: YbhB/YbcL family Raf kinase inhibitor-like protein [Zetaproteobacteria bacterium]|nr:MAG: YbhB/YbcL family Raf kinase inhibitor-like protein [Zetaproteobacteria bacterium]